MYTNPVAEFEELLQTQGLEPSLKFLNQRVKHRFTAIFRLNKDSIEIAHLIDKLDDPTTAPLSPVPFGNSFCEVVVKGGAAMTSNSVADRRFDGTSAQGVVIAYVGLPLEVNGKLFGTLCHIDYSQNEIDGDEFAFLQRVMGVLPRYL